MMIARPQLVMAVVLAALLAISAAYGFAPRPEDNPEQPVTVEVTADQAAYVLGRDTTLTLAIEVYGVVEPGGAGDIVLTGPDGSTQTVQQASSGVTTVTLPLPSTLGTFTYAATVDARMPNATTRTLVTGTATVVVHTRPAVMGITSPTAHQVFAQASGMQIPLTATVSPSDVTGSTDGDPALTAQFTVTDLATLTVAVTGTSPVTGGTATYVWGTASAVTPGRYRLEVTATDSRGAMSAVRLPVEFRVNTPPVATADPLGTADMGVEDASLTVAAPGVLANDVDPDGDPLTLSVLVPPSHGTLVLAQDGGLTFTPAANWNGTATFVYGLSDGWNTASATVTLTVQPVNDAPSFALADMAVMAYGSQSQTIAGWATAIAAGPADETGQHVTFQVAVDTPALFAALPQLDATGTLTFTPADRAQGVATLTVTLQDDGGTANGGCDSAPPQTATITCVPVNQAPSFTTGADPTVLEDSGLHTAVGWATAISAGPPDEAGQAVTFLVTGNTNPALFSVPPSVSAGGTLVFAPAPNAYGTATIGLRLCDDGGTAHGGEDTSAEQTVTITVTAVNDLPGARPQRRYVLANTPLAFTLTAGHPANEAQALTYRVVAAPTHGTLSRVPGTAFDGTLTYTPGTDFLGDDGFTIIANDGVGDGPTAVIHLVVVPGSTPTAMDDGYGVCEASGLTVGAPGVLQNDTGTPGRTLEAAVGTDVQHGTLALAEDGGFTYTPVPGFVGTDQFTYTVSDGTQTSAAATVTLWVATPFRGSVTRVSEGTGGIEGDRLANEATISADGLHVAFASDATTLVGADGNGVQDIFVYDRETGTTELVTMTYFGMQTESPAYNPSISADGDVVAFESADSYLVPGDTNGLPDVFVYVRSTGEMTRVSVAPGGSDANGESYAPSLSANGRLVAFQSFASNLVAGDTNGAADIFVYDLDTRVTTRVSVATGGSEGRRGDACTPSISADGNIVAFGSDADNLVAGDSNGTGDVFVHNRLTGDTRRVSVGLDGGDAKGNSTGARVSGDGRYVAFASDAANLVPDDTNAIRDAFVADLQTGVITRVSVARDGSEANDASGYPCISHDGRYVAFSSAATNLVMGDRNGADDVFRYDGLTGEVIRVSAAAPLEADGPSYEKPAISASGDCIAFASDATNLVGDDHNGVSDVFVWEAPTPGVALKVAGCVTKVPVGTGVPCAAMTTGEVVSVAFFDNGVCIGTDETPADGWQVLWIPAAGGEHVLQAVATDVAGTAVASPCLALAATTGGAVARVANQTTSPLADGFGTAVSADGRWVAFAAYDGDLAATDTNGVPDVLLYDTTTQAIVRVSQAIDGTPANDWSGEAAVNADGSVVVFTSRATNLIAGDTPGDQPNLYLWTRATGALTRLTTALDGGAANGPSWGAAVSADGHTIAFLSDADNLVAGDTNGAPDVFVLNRMTGVVQRIASAPGTTQSGGQVAITADGSAVAFASDDDTLTLDDVNGRRDVFIYACATGTLERVSWSWDGSDGTGESWGATLSDDGAQVAFVSSSTSLVGGRAPVAVAQAFVMDHATGTMRRVSGPRDAGDQPTLQAAITGDGQAVIFASEASNLGGKPLAALCGVMRYSCAEGHIDQVSVGDVLPGVAADRWDVACSAHGDTVAFVSRPQDPVDSTVGAGKATMVWQQGAGAQ